MLIKPKRRKFPPHVYAGIVLRQRGRCACCPEKLQPGKIHYDHIIPLSMGGKDAPENLQALILKHHAVKTSKEATIRAKCDRIRAKHTGQRLNARDREISRILERSGAS